MSSQTVKHPTFTLFYEKTNITEDIKASLVSLTYTDFLTDQSDEIQVKFEDINGKWVRGWFPTQGDKLHLALGYEGEPLVPLGAFEIDEIEWQKSTFGGSEVTLKALSTGLMKANRTLKPKAYENTTLADIVRKVAKNLDLSVTGTVANIPIKRVTQYQERDVEFLTRLAHEYHHSFKIVGKKLVFTTMESLNQREAVAVLNLAEALSLRFRDKIKDTAKAVKVTGFNSEKKKTLIREKPTKNKRKSKHKTSTNKRKSQVQTSNADTLKIVTRGESEAQIEARANAASAQNEEERQAGNLTLIGNPKLVAGNTIQLADFGLFSGKYLIKSARHSISARSSGYTTELEIRMLDYIEDEKTTDDTVQHP